MVAGAKWEGSKTVFHDDANDASQDPERRQAASRQDVALASLPQVVHQDQPDHVSESQDDLPKKKWKKMALAELQKVMTHLVAHIFRHMTVSCQCYMHVVLGSHAQLGHNLHDVSQMHSLACVVLGWAVT